MNKSVFSITQNSFYTPILRFLSDGKIYKVQELREKLIYNFHLKEDELNLKLESGSETVFANRFRWARFHLRKAGLISSISLDEAKITPKGLSLFKRKQKITKDKILPKSKKEGAVNIGKQSREIENEKDLVHEILSEEQLPEDTPDDQIQEIITKNERTLPKELLQLLRGKDPAFFEKVVIELIEELYGSVEKSEHTGGFDDKGIDGIVKPDKFGFEAIYIQAKRYKDGNMVGRSELSKFVGDLMRHNALRGVFITTSDFYYDAIEFWKDLRNQPKVILINGPELVKLMIENEIGVKPNKYTLKSINEDYFNKS